MALNVKISLIGALDMLKFKNMSKDREKVIQAAPAKEISAVFPINENAKALHPDSINLVVKQVVDHPEAGAKSFIFGKKDGSPLPYFRAGQYLSLKLQIGGSFVSRPYSISSGPKWALDGMYAVTIKSNPGGFAADWALANLKEGDALISSAPLGDFYFDKYRDCRDVVALAGGSGITPFLSMAYAIKDGVENFNLTILFGSRTEDSILYRKELDEICAACPKVKVVHILSDEDKEGFEKGFITADLIRKYAPDKYSIFICGPEAMYRFVEKEVAKLGLSKRLVRRELLGVTKRVWEQPGYPEKARNQVFFLTVKQGPETYTVRASANVPILVSLERAGIKAPSRCRSGECGWCRSRVVSGSYFMPEENDGRRWADKEHNYIHPCATFPLSDMTIEIPGEYL